MAESVKDTIFRPHTRNLCDVRFDNLLVVSFSHYSNGNKAFWNCICDCGKSIIKNSVSLIKFGANSCGCIPKPIGNRSIHGLTNTRVFKIRLGMLQRCYNENEPHFKDYGDRGIKVCNRWIESVENFFEDMGHPPTIRHTLERRDNNGNYEPDNCYWATKKEQQQNKRDTIYLEINGVKGTVNKWSEISGTCRQTIITRYFRKYSHYECVYGKDKSQLN